MIENEVSRITEKRNPLTENIDQLSTPEVLRLINEEDAKVTDAIRKVLPSIAQAVDGITDKMRCGGRLFYIGAGTSGRLGVLDAVECVPTFGLEPGRVVGILAGGKEAMFQSQEKVEDDYSLGVKEIIRYKINELDSVIGIAASGRTPYVLGALDEARKRGAATIGLFCASDMALEPNVDILIVPIVGPEVLTGSTRMKAGTAQKMVLNMISTTVMIKLGKAYSNLMVDMNPTNYKLKERTRNIFITITKADAETATEFLEKAKYNIKAAIVMYERRCSLEEAIRLLKEKDGFLRKVIHRT